MKTLVFGVSAIIFLCLIIDYLNHRNKDDEDDNDTNSFNDYGYN